jgi:putative transposase
MKVPAYPEQGSAALRRGRRSETDRIYLITFTCHHRESLFGDWIAANVAARAFIEPRLWRGSLLLCWVLMPDHWHGLVQLSDTETLASLIGRVKAITARAVNTACGENHCVWSRGYHDHALRVEEDLLTVARYIVANPVRAGLCEHAGQYPFWDAIWLT